MIVVDASAAIELLLNTATGQAVARAIASPEETLHAPHLLDLEVARVLRRYLAAKQLGVAEATIAIEHLRQLDLTRYAHEPLLPRIWELRPNLTAYDAAYVSLAEALDGTLLEVGLKFGRYWDVSWYEKDVSVPRTGPEH